MSTFIHTHKTIGMNCGMVLCGDSWKVCLTGFASTHTSVSSFLSVSCGGYGLRKEQERCHYLCICGYFHCQYVIYFSFECALIKKPLWYQRLITCPVTLFLIHPAENQYFNVIRQCSIYPCVISTLDASKSSLVE